MPHEAPCSAPTYIQYLAEILIISILVHNIGVRLDYSSRLGTRLPRADCPAYQKTGCAVPCWTNFAFSLSESAGYGHRSYDAMAMQRLLMLTALIYILSRSIVIIGLAI